ncbi:hypothetical protein OIE43_11340 [Streptomyces pseudovenezuelae]|nr:hypothetical protein [Streptomyces pseudovenezuelae]
MGLAPPGSPSLTPSARDVSLGYGGFLGSGRTFWVRKVRSGEVGEV